MRALPPARAAKPPVDDRPLLPEKPILPEAVKNIPEDVYAGLKRSAKLNRRSINSEIIVCIERSLRGRGFDAEEIQARASRFRELTRGHEITDDEFTPLKRAGRP